MHTGTILEGHGEKGREIFVADWKRSPEERNVCLELERIGKEVGAPSIQAGESPRPVPRAAPR